MIRRASPGWLLPLCLAAAPPPDAVQPLRLSHERLDLACLADLRRLTNRFAVPEHAAKKLNCRNV